MPLTFAGKQYNLLILVGSWPARGTTDLLLPGFIPAKLKLHTDLIKITGEYFQLNFHGLSAYLRRPIIPRFLFCIAQGHSDEQ